MMKRILSLGIFLLSFFSLMAQSDSIPKDTIANQDQIYNRPFITLGRTSTAVGGYVEGNTNYFVEDGLEEGFSMELRRFNIFLFSSIADRVRFLSELEFEHGVQEIALETALLDVDIIGANLVFRGGILLPPLGQFNVNHDSPKWEFIERPMVSEMIIPSTLSEIGFGFYGKQFAGDLMFTYDFYIVNGLQEGVVLSEEGRTFLPAGKAEGLVGLDNNGTPSITGRAAARLIGTGEVGLSFYTGPYNTFRADGEMIDEKRGLTILAADVNFSIGDLTAVGEFAHVSIDVPASVSELFGSKQWGGFLDLTYPIINQPVKAWERSSINLSTRLEMVDFNVGTFTTTGTKIRDEDQAVALGLALRTGPDTIIRANYRYHFIKDLLGNPTIKRAGFQFGLASYF